MNGFAAPLAQSTPNQRYPFYKDVEDLISPGFLTHNVVVNGLSMSFRTLGPGDIFLLQARVAKGDEETWKLWTVASSLWLLDGFVILENANAAPYIFKSLKRLPRNIRDLLFSQVLGLFNRQHKALEAVEAYSYETFSRYRWKSFSEQALPGHAGLRGAVELGTNHLQRMWTYYNEMEDTRNRDETMREGSKLTASAMAGKGIQKIDERDKLHRNTERARRQRVLDRFYYTMLGYDIPDEESEEKKHQIHGSKTVEELQDEMRRWVSGEDDFHDKIVRDYKERVTAQYEAEKKARHAQAVAIRKQEDETDIGLRPTTALVGYSEDQMRALLAGKDPGPIGVRILPSDNPQVQDHLYNKFLKEAPVSPTLRAARDHLEVPEGKDLTSVLADRQVSFRTEDTVGE